ncbi:MAG: phosphomevalonate decarboxylase MvaD [Halobacteria archaeon]|nr:phosphomevalonate decarboxylase MvaD [Halobacteria archaeon]
MKATARAHPIQGLIKYHGLREKSLRIPYHDSISVCTAPSSTVTTVEFGHETDTCVVNGEEIDETGYERVVKILDRVRELSDIETGARVESENNFPSNVGLGASSSAFAALALAATEGAGLDLSLREVSAIARRGATSASRSVTGGFSHLRTSMMDEECASERIEDGFDDDIRIVVGLVPAFKHTARAHEEASESHLFEGRLAYVHGALAEMRKAIHDGDFHQTFSLAESDSLSLLAVTMTGPENWVYWQPETIELLNTVRELREEGVSVYFSTDTGATAYLNTTSEYVDRVADEVEALGIEPRKWEVGGPAEVVEDDLF